MGMGPDANRCRKRGTTPKADQGRGSFSEKLDQVKDTPLRSGVPPAGLAFLQERVEPFLGVLGSHEFI